MELINLEIITPSRKVYSGMVKSVTLPGSAGNFQVLIRHAPVLSTLEIGRIKIVDESDKTFLFSTSGGTVEVLKNKIVLLAESIEKSEEIDAERALSSYRRAKERLRSRNEKIDQARAESSLLRAINRLKLVNRTPDK